MTATLPTKTAMTTCAAHGRPHRTEPGLQLCRNHLDELSGWLYDVEREAGAVDARPSLQGSWNATRGGRLASHQAPARVNSLVHGDPRRVAPDDLIASVGTDGTLSVVGFDGTLSAFGTLHLWANEIRDARQINFPGEWVVEQILPGPRCEHCIHPSCRRLVSRYFRRDRLTVATERHFLSRHLEWAAAHLRIGDLYDDIRTLRSQLQAANGTGEPKIPGRCPEPDCGGPLRAVKPEHTSGVYVHVGDSLLQAVECERDATHRWEAHHLIRLGVILEEQSKGHR